MKQKFSLEEVLETIKTYTTLHGYPPTNRELAKEFCCSLSTVNACLREMLNTGMLETDHPAGACRAFRVPGMKMVDTQKLEKALEQLDDLLYHCRDMAIEQEDLIWNQDVEALEMVIGALRN